jgi:hypothetical protein
MAYDRKQGRHEVAQSSRPDYRLEVGHAEVPVGAPRSFVVLDAARAATLKAWTATLIPAGGRRPDAGSVGAAEYIDATVFQVAAIRPALFHGIDEIERIAQSTTRRAFTECSAQEREAILRQFQAADDSDAFNMVNDFTYEAYYGHPDVQAAIEAETGWRAKAPMSPSVIPPFDSGLLKRVRSLPSRFRAVEADKGVKT